MEDLILHIGMQRTGSTFLQTQVFPKMQINFRKDRNKTEFNYFRNIEKVSKEKILEMIKPFLKKNKINLISDENIWWHQDFSHEARYKKLKKIKQVFPDAKIIFGIRDQEDLLLSWYKKYVTMGGILNFLEYQKKIVSFSDLDYSPYIKKLRKIFGENNICIYQFEQLKNNPKSFVKFISNFVGVNSPNFENKKHNRGYSLWQLKLCILLNHLWKTKLNPEGFIPIHYSRIPYRFWFQNPYFPGFLRGRELSIEDIGEIIK